MILVDTSAWVEFFRGRDPLASAVDDALATDDAALCGPVETELRRGLRGRGEKERVVDLLATCHFLDAPPALWREAGDLGFVLRARGVTVKTLDLLVATHALAHDAPVLSGDRDFVAMRRAGVPLMLAPPEPGRR